MPDPTQHERSAWIKGIPGNSCKQPHAITRPWRLILLGAPGIGKGTQAEMLTSKTGACQLSTGEVFRAVKSIPSSERSPAIREAIEFMIAGKLVPDATVIALIKERMHCLRCPSGFLLDGFPRTVAQAEALGSILWTEGIGLDGVISYELPVEKIVARIAGRRVCSGCKQTYHMKDLPPKTDDVCDKCGGSLFQRDDDRPEAVRVRLAIYEKSTAPLIEYYENKGILFRIDCAETPKETFQRSLRALGIS